MRILCFGDSNTYGYDPRDPLGGRYPADCRWTDLLCRATGWTVLNRGENGRQIPHTPYLREQAQRMLKANASADLVVILLGTNDVLQGLTVPEITSRMELFLTDILSLCRRVLLMVPVPLAPGEWVTDPALMETSAELSQAYRDLARRLNIDFADTGEWNIDLCFDGVHFSPAGHRIFARQLQRHLQ